MLVTGKILTFDLATNTGFASGEPEWLPTFGSHKFAPTGDDYGKWQANARSFFERTLTIEQPEFVAYEQPSLFGTTQPATVIKLCSLVTTLEEVCRYRGVRVRQVNPSQLKKFWTGRGNAKKPEMVKAAWKFGFRVQNDDEADAVAMWFFSVQCYGTDDQKKRFQQMQFEAGMGVAQAVAF